MGCKAINTKKSKRHSADGEETNFLPGFSLLETLLKCEKSAMGIPMNNDSAKKWHQLGLHVRQKQPAPSAEVRRTTPEVVCAPPDMSSYAAGVARARGRARLRRAAEQAACRVGDDEAARKKRASMSRNAPSVTSSALAGARSLFHPPVEDVADTALQSHESSMANAYF